MNLLSRIQKRFIWTALAACAVFCADAFAQSGPRQLNISGGLFQPNGNPVLSNNVSFRLEIRDKAGTCVLYSEVHTGQDLSQTKGGFSLLLGAGVSGQNNIAGGSVLTADVFKNTGIPTGAFTDCPSGVTMSPGDERVVRVYYDLGGGYTAMNPDVPIVAAAYTMVAETLQGKEASDFIQIPGTATSNLTQSNAEYAFSLTNWQRLKDLIDGVSSQYLPTAGTGAFDFGNRLVTGLSNPGTTTDAVNKGYADGYVGGKQVDVSAVGPAAGDGHTLIWDQNANRWVTGVPSAIDDSKLPLAGGTMSGAINMNSYDFLGVGHITMAYQKTLTFGRYDNAQEAVLVGTMGTANMGATWYNTETQSLKVFNGTSALEQAYLDPASKLNAAWFPVTGVTANTYGAANTVPVFTVGLDGRITAAYGTTISGVAPGGAAGGDLTGTYPNPLIASDAITSAKVNSNNIAVNRLVATDATTGANLTYFECDLNEIMAWTASGWGCTTVYALSPVKTVAGKTPDAAGDIPLNAADITGLGNAATKTYGTAAGNLVELDGTGKVPASVLPAGTGTITEITAVAPLQGGGVSGNVTVSIDVGTGANQVLRLNGTAQIPAVDGSLLTNVNASSIGTRAVSSAAPNPDQVLGYNGLLNQWEPMSAAVGSVTSIESGVGLVPGTITSAGTINIDVGSTAGKIVQVDGSNRLPVIDGSLLTNVDAVTLQTRPVASTGPVLNQVLAWNGSQWEPMSNSALGVVNVTSGIGLMAGTITSAGTINIDVGSTAGKIVQVDGSNRLPVIDGSLLTNVDAVTLQTRPVASTGPSLNQVLAWNGSQWEPTSNSALGVVSVTSGTGLIAGTITSTGTIEIDVGSTAGKIVQLDGSGAFPVIDATNLINVNASRIGTRTVSSSAPNPDQVLGFNGLLNQWEPMSAAVGSVTNVEAGVGLVPGNITSSGTINVDVGSTAGKIVQVDSSNRLPVIDGSLLTNVDAVTLQTRPVASTGPSLNQVLAWNGSQWEPMSNSALGVVSVTSGTGLVAGTITSTGTIEIDVGSTAGKIVQLDGSGAFPVIDATNLINVNASRIGTRTVSSAAPGADQVLGYNGLLNQWEPMSAAVGSVTNVEAGVGLVPGNITSSGTINVDVGSTAGKIVQVDGSNRLPVIDGSLLTNVDAVTLQTRPVASTGPTLNQVLAWNGSQWEPMSNSALGVVSVTSGTGLVAGTITSTGTIEIDVGSTAGKIVQVDSSDRLPVIDGSLLTNVNSTQLQGRPVASDGPTSNQVLMWNGSQWEPANASSTLSWPLAASPGTSSPGTPSYSFSGDTDTGLYSPGPGTAALSTNGVARVTVNPAGNVGVGTTAPNYPLEVTGVIASREAEPLFLSYDTSNARTSDNMSGGLEIRDSADAIAGFMGFESGDSTTDMIVGVNTGASSGGLRLQTAGSNRMFVGADGNIGINTLTPASALDISVTGTNSALIVPRDSTANRPAGNVADGMIRYNTDLNYFEAYENGQWKQMIQTGTSGTAAWPLLANPGTTPPSAPSYSFNGDTDTGLFSPAAGKVSLTSNGTTGLTLSDGNVGIGTTTPDYKLDVNGAMTATAIYNRYDSDSLINFSGGMIEITANGRNLIQGDKTGTFWVNIGDAAEPTGEISVLNNTSFSGKVGIGTATPGSLLDVSGGSTFRGAVQLNDGPTMAGYIGSNAQFFAGGSTDVSMYAVGAVRFYAGSSESMRIANGGNVGIGTTSPVAKLQVRLASDTNIGFVNDGGNAEISAWNDSASVTKDIYIKSMNLHVISAGGADEYLTVANGGNVGIGTTSPKAALAVAANGTNSAILVPRDTTANRPAGNATNGMIRYNTNLNYFEAYENGQWKQMIQTGTSGTAAWPLLANPGTTPPSAPSYSFSGDTDTGLLSQAAGTLGLATNGTTRLTVTAAGNLGIGTSSPTEALTIYSGTESKSISVAISGTVDGQQSMLNLFTKTSASNHTLGTGTAKGWQLWANSDATSVGMVPNSFGIGYADGSTWSNPAFQVDAATNNVGINHELWETSLSTLGVGGNVAIGSYSVNNAAPTDGLIVSGKVGIGTASPGSVALEVVGTGANNSAILIPRNTTALRPAGMNGMIRYNTNLNYFEAFEDGQWKQMIQTGVSGTASWPLLANPGTSPSSAPSYSFTGDTNTGMYSPAADVLAFASAGTGFMGIFPNGTVGIGQVSGVPTYLVEAVKSYDGLSVVNVSNAASGTGAGSIFYAKNNLGSGAMFGVLSNGYSGSGPVLPNTGILMTESNIDGLALITQGAKNMTFSTNTVERMRIDGTGKVGIGTTSPGSVALEVAGTGANNSAILIPRSTTALRPAGSNGMIRYNTNLNYFEAFEDGQWKQMIQTAVSGTASWPLLANPGTTAPGAPSYSFTGDTDTGLFSPAAGRVSLTSNGTAGLTLYNGNVGIGISAPSDRLHVYSNENGERGVLISNASSGAGAIAVLSLQNDASYGQIGMASTNYSGNAMAAGRMFFYANSTSDGMVFDNGGPDPMIFAISNTEAMRLSSTGNLGIGTSTPEAALAVASTGTNSAILVPRSTTANRPAGNATNGMIRYNLNTNKFEFFENGGWVNYGTGSGSASFPLLASPGTSHAGAPSYSFASDSNTGIYSPSSDRLAFATSGTEAMSIDSSGRLHVSRGILFDQGPAATDNLNYLSSTSAGAVNASMGWFAAGVGSSSASEGPYFLMRGNSFNNIASQRGMVYFSAGNITSSPSGNDGSILFNTGHDVLRMKIDREGRVQIGDGSGLAGTYTFEVNSGSEGSSFNTSWAGSVVVPLQLYNTASHQAGNGTALSFKANSSSSTASELARVSAVTTNSTTATFAGDLVFATSNGGALGERMRIMANGNIGVNTSTPGDAVLNLEATGTNNSAIVIPRATTSARPNSPVNGMLRYNTNTNKFEAFENGGWTNMISTVNGSMKISGQFASGSNTITSGTNSIDFNDGNAISTDYDCGSTLSFANLRDGGTYTLVITGTGTTQCNFPASTTGDDAASVTYRFKPANAQRNGNSHTVYTLMRVGSVVYVSWGSGF